LWKIRNRRWEKKKRKKVCGRLQLPYYFSCQDCFFFFFLTCSHKRGEGRFTLVTSSSWSVVSTRLSYPLYTCKCCLSGHIMAIYIRTIVNIPSHVIIPPLIYFSLMKQRMCLLMVFKSIFCGENKLEKCFFFFIRVKFTFEKLFLMGYTLIRKIAW
jgi:hypothetical protein